MSDEIQKPQCVGFIMDGNRRWAEIHGVSSMEGHAHGYEAFKSIIDVIHRAHIPHMVCYAFSTENWKRTEDEVGYLMKLLDRALRELYTSITKDGKKIKLRVIGERAQLPEKLIAEIDRVENIAMQDHELTLWLALSYGGRAEIVNAVNRAIEEGKKITEETFAKLLWTETMPDPDLVIRTSGECRTSNFLPWQSVYSELFFTNTLWPDFGEIEFQSILDQYGKRSRRKGA